MLSDYYWYRKWRGGTWYLLRPYDNLYSFSHMRYWTRRPPLSNEVVILIEDNGKKGKR